MKKYLFFSIFLILFISSVSAIVLTEPYSETFTISKEFSGKTWSGLIYSENVKTCSKDTNWQTKDCDYLYFCYAVLPASSTNIGDALRRECIDITDSEKTLELVEFVPPKGVLYYVTTFIVKVDVTCNLDSCKSTEWTYTPSIPFLNAHQIRSVCPDGQMLWFDQYAGEYVCHVAQRICLDTMNTGICQNVYDLYALDLNNDGYVDEQEMVDGSNFCADRPRDLNNDGYVDAKGDGICDLVADLECPDVCSLYERKEDGTFVCINNYPNNLCDEWDKAAWFACKDDVLSPNSKICDDIDTSLCSVEYQPVCVGGRGGTTYPNKCFAKASGETTWEQGNCDPDIVQCYVAEDCQDLDVCIGGSISGIQKQCLSYMCEYTGTCGNLACETDADCVGIADNTCVGVYGTCEGNVCVVSGSCLEPPGGGQVNIWDLIQQLWTLFWQWILSLFS